MRRILLTVLASLAALSLGAQKVTPQVGVTFEGRFVNDEFDASGQSLMASGTLGAARLFPYAGIRFGKIHGLYAGVDVVQDFGVSPIKPMVELAIWYQLRKEHFSLYAGLIPCGKLKGSYSSAIWSDANAFYDGILDGLILQGTYDRSFWEVGLDWCGKYGDHSREQFSITTAGDLWFTNWLSLGWEGLFHHFACSVQQKGVVDDHLFHPFLKWDFASFTGMQKLELHTGAMIGYQVDRLMERKSFPVGADLVLEVQKWNFGLRNEAYYGGSQAPFYKLTDETGEVYGDKLYFRSSIWQITPDATPGFYDRVDAYWEKGFWEDRVSLGVRLAAHFGQGGFLGWQQLLSATVKIDNITFRKHKK
jgi:hypothetical protein